MINRIRKTHIIIVIAFIITFLLTISFNQYNKYFDKKIEKELSEITKIISDGKIKYENEGKLVLVTGKLVFNEETAQNVYTDSKTKTSGLTKLVERYQWYEEKTTDENGNLHYTYKKIWANYDIDSSKFNKEGYNNPKNNIVGAGLFYPEHINVGDYELPEKLKAGIEWKRIILKENVFLIDGFRIINNYATNSKSIDAPEVGDIRISYYYTDWDTVTILAKQAKTSFKPYEGYYNKRIYIIINGKKDLSEIANFFNYYSSK